jgi:hypothetical protein
MSTLQMYVGRGNNFPSTAPAAKKQAKTSCKPDQRQSQSSAGPAATQLLHIQLFYEDGRLGEMNVTSPNPCSSEDIETQYVYLKRYLRKMGPLLGIVAYQANICYPRPDGSIKILGTFPKVDCRQITPFAYDQYWENDQKGGLSHE